MTKDVFREYVNSRLASETTQSDPVLCVDILL